MGYFYSEEYLEHHGILGQKWGVRRFESAGGHLTAAGKARYNSVDGKYQKIKAAKATANESYKKFNSDWNKAALASVSLSKKKRAEAAALRAKAKASGEKADEDIANIKKAKTDYKFEKKMAKVDAERDKILDMRAKNREKLENKKWDDEKKAAKLKDFDKDTEYVKAGYEKYNKVLSNYRDAKMGSLDKEMAKNAKKDYVNQVLSDIGSSKSMTVLGYASDAAKKATKSTPSAKDLKKESKELSKSYDKALTDGYKKNGDKLKKYSGDKYYDLVDSIERDAAKKVASEYKKAHGEDPHLDQLSNSKDSNVKKFAYWNKEGK